MNKKSASSVGITFGDGLQLVFIALKLAKVIDWPWIWVLSPLWIELSLLVVALIIYVVSSIIENHNSKLKNIEYEVVK